MNHPANQPNSPAVRTRREFLGALSAAGTAALVAAEPRLATAAKWPAPPPAKADCCILLWMAGGMPAADTFDPKRYRPFEVGLPVEQVISTFPPIDTAVDGLAISQGLEHLAQVMDRGTLVRSVMLPELRHDLHTPHQYLWHTGYAHPPSIAPPHLGAWIAHVRGPNSRAIPPFIQIGQRLNGHAESEAVRAYSTAGFLGSKYNPVNLPYPEDAPYVVQPLERMHEQLPAGTKARQAFDLSLEDRRSFDQYNTSRFGRGCLLARRLAEAGARFIEVSTDYVPFAGWDAHEYGHAAAGRMKRKIDRPIAQLVLDLEARGLLDRTLVIVASEFSRDLVDGCGPGNSASASKLWHPRQYGLHYHFAGASSVMLFGGGVKQGVVYGQTADERPCVVTENPVALGDLQATILSLMGVSAATRIDVRGRPYYITENGRGKPMEDIVA